MDDSFSSTIRRSKRIKNRLQDMIIPKEYLDPYYNHFTLRARNLSEYINVIGILNSFGDNSLFGRLVFRGHSDASSNYKLIPTIGRNTVGIEFRENSMVTEMLTLRPEQFAGITSDFDLLSKLQHFGLPTRILDFTYNPLIALYFACCSLKKTESRIVCTYDTSSPFSSYTIERICGMYRYVDYNATSLDQVLGGVSELKKYASVTMEHLMAKPLYSNDRIKNQAAVFMIFPNEIYDYRSQMVVLGAKKGNEEEYRRFPMNEGEEKRLEFIRKEPEIYKDKFCVNAATLRSLFQYYRNKFDDFEIGRESEINPKYHFLFQNRFSVLDMIQELSAKSISNNYISIIIEAKDKKRIIDELEIIGINKAFVFPELEYTAEMVKNRFALKRY